MRPPLIAYATVLQLGLTQSVLLASLPLLVHLTGLSEQIWSWCLGGTLFLYALAAPYWGRQVDSRGPARTGKVAALGTTLGNVLLLVGVLVPTPVMAAATVLVSRVSYALFAAGQYPSSQASVMLASADSRVQVALGRLLAFNQCGRLLGPVLVAAFATNFYLLPIAVLAVMSLLLAGASFYDDRKTRRLPPLAQPLAKTASPLPRRRIAPALAAAWLVSLSVSYLQVVLAFSLGEHFGLEPQPSTVLLSALLMSAAVATLLGQLTLLPLLSRRPALHVAAIAGALTAAASLLLLEFTRAQLFIAVIVFAAGQGIASPLYTAWARNRAEGAVGRISAVLMAAHTIGHGTGVLLAGLFAGQHLVPALALIVFAGLMQVGLMVFMTVFEK